MTNHRPQQHHAGAVETSSPRFSVGASSQYHPINLFAAAAILLLFFLLRWNSYNAPLTRDEGEYVYAAQLLRHGLLPYEHSFLQKPPMIAYSYAVAEFVRPGCFWLPRLVAALCAAGATALLGWIAFRHFGRGVAWPAMFFMTPMILLPKLEQFGANTEMFMLFPLMVMAALCAHCYETGGGQRLGWFGIGALGAITILYKYTAFPLIVLLLVLAAWRQRTLRAWAGFVIWLTIGAVVTAFAILSPFLWRDGGRAFWECTVVFNRFYSTTLFSWPSLQERIGLFAGNWWIAIALAVVSIWRPNRRILFAAAVFLVACLTTTGSVYGHYYITIMPFWALLMAIAVKNVTTWFVQRSRFLASPRWLAASITALVVILLCASDLKLMTLSQRNFLGSIMRAKTAYLGPPVVARRVAELTTPRDYVCVAGSDPQILAYAQRFSSTRFINSYPLMIPTPLVLPYQREAIQDLESNVPEVIVLDRSPSSWGVQPNTPKDYLAYLSRLADQEFELLGGYVRDDADGHWEEPLGQGQLANATFLLLKRKHG